MLIATIIGKPLIVYISISLRNILDIDELRQVQFNMIFSLDFVYFIHVSDYNTGDYNEIILAGFETERK